MKISEMSKEELEKKVEQAFDLLLESRDALPAISLASAKIHRIDLRLADRIEDWLSTWETTE